MTCLILLLGKANLTSFFFFGYTWITIIEVNSRSQCPFFSIVRFSFIANKIFFYFLYSLLKYLWNQRAHICY